MKKCIPERWQSKNGKWTLEFIETRVKGKHEIKATDGWICSYGFIADDGKVYWDIGVPKYIHKKACVLAKQYIGMK